MSEPEKPSSKAPSGIGHPFRSFITQTLPTAKDRDRAAAIVIGLAGLLAVVSSFLPWVSVATAFGTFSRSGLDDPVYGVVVLVIGILAVLVGVGLSLSTAFPSSIALLTLVAGGVSAAIAFENSSTPAGTDVGAGVWLLYVAGFLMLAGGIVLMQDRAD